jgi:hypothetical protein
LREVFELMLSAISLLILAAALFAPPIILSKRANRFSWPVRYFLSVLPVCYTFLGWQVGAFGYEFFSCQGNVKGFQGCVGWGIDFTSLIGHGLFLMIPCVFVALPISVLLTIDTASKQIGAWHKRNFPNTASSDE